MEKHKMDAKVNWKGRMSFIGTANSGFEVKLGSDPSVGGDDDGFRPMELMAISLAGCTAMDVISILSKKRQEVTDFEVKVYAERADEHPKVMTSARIDYLITGHNVDEAAVVRAIELSAVRYCPAQGMLSKVMPIDLNYEIYEDKQDGEAVLVKAGTYQPQA
jgi:putative redox protein